MSWKIPASIYIDLAWAQWDDLTLDLPYNVLHQLDTVCVSVPQIKLCPAPSHQMGPGVKWLHSLLLVRFTTSKRPWDTFLHYLSVQYINVTVFLGSCLSGFGNESGQLSSAVVPYSWATEKKMDLIFSPVIYNLIMEEFYLGKILDFPPHIRLILDAGQIAWSRVDNISTTFLKWLHRSLN